jgi:L-fuconate dehydratase
MSKLITIKSASALDKRYKLKNGAGSDAVHSTSTYGYAVCVLKTDAAIEGIGLAFTLGGGNPLVCQAIKDLSANLEGREINDLMSDFGNFFRKLADDPDYRWLGPHKGVVHLALAAITNACYDLWAKSKGVPLWNLLNNLPIDALLNTLDFTYIDDVLTKKEASQILLNQEAFRTDREQILKTGYRGYDTSVGWFNYSDEQVKNNVKKAIDAGFTAIKLKVGSKEGARDIRRAKLIRETSGDNISIMLDANQQWSLKEAISICKELEDINPYWIEEPTHPDDVNAHRILMEEIKPMKIALGEHVPNRIVFKNYLQAGCMDFNQADAVRVGGISEYITISLMSKKFGVPMVPHVGDMGQIHQHLVLFNHIRVGHEALFLEYIPHLKEYFKTPAIVSGGFYKVPQEPGMSSDLIDMN